MVFVFINVQNDKTQCILRKFMDNIKLEDHTKPTKGFLFRGTL